MTNFRELRRTTGLSQHAFAELMGVPIRTLQDLEYDKNRTRSIHLNAAYFAILKLYRAGKVAHENLPAAVRAVL